MRLRRDITADGLLYVSIHASVKDATNVANFPNLGINVSIHASVKDATEYMHYTQLRKHGFNPRICKRCDTLNGVQQHEI